MIENVSSTDFDMIVLPGGLPNAFTLADNIHVQKLLKEFKEANKNIEQFVLHLCTTKAEVLNTNYTCYPSFEQK